LLRAAQRLACEGERPSEARVRAAHPKGVMAVLRLPLRVDRSIYYINVYVVGGGCPPPPFGRNFAPKFFSAEKNVQLRLSPNLFA
jgi:hypothetical protein